MDMRLRENRRTMDDQKEIDRLWAHYNRTQNPMTLLAIHVAGGEIPVYDDVTLFTALGNIVSVEVKQQMVKK